LTLSYLQTTPMGLRKLVKEIANMKKKLGFQITGHKSKKAKKKPLPHLVGISRAKGKVGLIQKPSGDFSRDWQKSRAGNRRGKNNAKNGEESAYHEPV